MYLTLTLIQRNNLAGVMLAVQYFMAADSRTASEFPTFRPILYNSYPTSLFSYDKPEVGAKSIYWKLLALLDN